MNAVRFDRHEKRGFILRQQGLSDPMRWTGDDGLAPTLRGLGRLQLDWVRIVAPSHWLSLYARVGGFSPATLAALLYGQARSFIEYGGFACIHPIEAIPFLRGAMRAKIGEPRWRAFAEEHGNLIRAVFDLVHETGAVRKRDVAGFPVRDYRGSTAGGVALYYLWLAGEICILRRDGLEAVYAPMENVISPGSFPEPSAEESQDFLLEQRVRALGAVPYRVRDASAAVRRMLDDGRLTHVEVDGEGAHLLVTADLEVLRRSDARMTRLARLLSPLDMVVARGRAKELFGVDFIWEIYKKPAQRRFGPYTMPVLYDDALIGRIDLRRDGPSRTLYVNGYWPESGPSEAEAAAGLSDAIAGLARFLDLERVGDTDRKTIIDVDACNRALAR